MPLETTLYIDCSATTNGSQSALYYYGLADSMSDILSSCVKRHFIGICYRVVAVVMYVYFVIICF